MSFSSTSSHPSHILPYKLKHIQIRELQNGPPDPRIWRTSYLIYNNYYFIIASIFYYIFRVTIFCFNLLLIVFRYRRFNYLQSF